MCCVSIWYCSTTSIVLWFSVFIRLLLTFSVFALLLMLLCMFSGIYSVLNIRVVPGSITVSTIPSFMGQQYTFPVGVSSLGSVVGHYGQLSVIDTEKCRMLKSDRSIQIKQVTSTFQVHKVIGLFTTVTCSCIIIVSAVMVGGVSPLVCAAN